MVAIMMLHVAGLDCEQTDSLDQNKTTRGGMVQISGLQHGTSSGKKYL